MMSYADTGKDPLWEHLLDTEHRLDAIFDQRGEPLRRVERDAIARRLAAMRWGRDHDRGAARDISGLVMIGCTVLFLVLAVWWGRFA